MSRRSGRSVGKRIRIDDVPDDNEMDTSGEGDEQDSSYDPMAFYKQQQQEMLLQATQHVQAAQEEIQQAQSQAAQEEQDSQQSSGGRRSRSAATAAKAALSTMNANERGMDDVVFERPTTVAQLGTGRGRGRPPGSGGTGRGRGRPPGSGAGASLAQRRSIAMSMERDFDAGFPSPRSKLGRRPIEVQAEDESSLYFIIRNGKASLQSVVDDWIDNYKSERDTALLSLMQFFISAAGCKGRITPQMQANMEHADIIRQMTEEFEEETGEYPLITPGQFWKKFKTNFCDFIQSLVKQCQYSIIYDQHLMDNAISLLTQLSDSQVRAFRHTATLAAMKLMTALVDVALNVSINMDNTQRQYDSEQQKTANKRATDRLEALMTRRKELEENTDEIKNMLTYMFKAVFVHRYRDTLPEIRSICMFEIGQWMHKYHSNFLDDTYLKYIGWTIHDKVGDVRLKCLQALQPLYASDDLKGKLELFTSKFKDRIVQMTLDKEYDVAVEAVKLVISILRYHPDMLSDKDSEHVYELVYCSHRAVAQAAGDFLNVRLFSEQDVDPDIRTRRGKKRLENTPHIRDLVQFFIESELHEHGAYLVDSLIESNPMMKDWECMTDLLLEEPGEMEEALDNSQETALIEVMVCCIRQAATGEPPVGRGPTRKGLSAKELKQVSDDKQALTAHFIQTLPPLLHKYLPDAEKIANLMVIPQYFDLDIYTTSRQEKNLDRLLSLIQEIVEKHSEKEVLEACAKTLERLTDENHAIFTRCGIARSRLLDSISNHFKEANDEYMSILQGKEDPDEDEMFNLVSSLKKVECFSNAHSMSECKIWESMFEVLIKYKESIANNEEIKLPVEAVKSSMCACYYGLIWDKIYLESDENRERDSTAHEVKRLRSDFDRYLKAMQEMMFQHVSGPGSILREEAFISVCDLLIFFCANGDDVMKSNSILAPLVYHPGKQMAQLLNEFIQSNVFVPEEDPEDENEQDDHIKIETLHKRRNFLAAFCKLIVYNVLPTKSAADIFKHYLMFYNDYGDIIKATLGKARENNKVNSAKTIVQALIIKFNELRHIQGEKVINRNTSEFVHLKELAKRFALSFGLDALKNRDAVAQLHREGILVSVNPMENNDDPSGPPPNLPFLEILAEFTNKLLKQDKKVVLKYLDTRIGDAMPSR